MCLRFFIICALFGWQHVRSSLIALGTKEHVLFHPDVNRVRCNSLKHHASGALWAACRCSRRGCRDCGVCLNHWPRPIQQSAKRALTISARSPRNGSFRILIETRYGSAGQ
jgi:hypothetical protein